MPLIMSGYQAPRWLRNGHAHTLFPAFFRRVTGVRYQRERMELPDGDFLDLDWSRVGSPRAVVITHGLEGSSRRQYVRGLALAFNRRGWDAVALNFRGCSGEPNRLARFYHSGVSEDLWLALQHVHAAGYESVAAAGFSLGGNVALKLAGELGQAAPSWLIGVAGISVPCDLHGASEAMASRSNRLYMRRFLVDLHAKIRAKQPRFPEQLEDSGYDRLRTFRDFDDRYTAPLHGFRDAEDYWARSSSLRVMPAIRCPALLLNALDDPFLAPSCFPSDLARGHAWLSAEFPDHGGHVGFVGGGALRGEYHSERRAAEFLESALRSRRTFAGISP
ncbi:MAG: alpha/beta fold hydrolase [Verrucomicrobia bacterium]|nr:alpha/beta fold hydrolase [Verrucomicrobiota bacterium]MBI3869425.1 alpha/beta fold hydrolase [Verrucomicrobiota bacterium]